MPHLFLNSFSKLLQNLGPKRFQVSWIYFFFWNVKGRSQHLKEFGHTPKYATITNLSKQNMKARSIFKTYRNNCSFLSPVPRFVLSKFLKLQHLSIMKTYFKEAISFEVRTRSTAVKKMTNRAMLDLFGTNLVDK